MTIGKLSGQCDFGQKGQSYCNQRGQSCVAKRVKVAWLFHMAMTDWELVLQKRTKIYFVQKQSESLFAGDSLDTMNYYY